MADALFVCLQNAGRSQMAQALFERAAAGRHGARSAGTAPATRVHPEVVAAMEEVGIALAGRVPHELTETDARWADVVATMGGGDKCPYIPGRRYVDWDLPDPAGRPIALGGGQRRRARTAPRSSASGRRSGGRRRGRCS